MTPRLREVEVRAWQAARDRDRALASDVAKRRAHGIVHTPPELARAVVRAGDLLLRERFGLRDGLCDPAVLLIDPACGPGAFMAAALALAEERSAAARPATLRGIGFDLDQGALHAAQALRAHPAGAGLEFARADFLDGSALLTRAAAHSGVLFLLGNPPWATGSLVASAASQTLLEDFRVDDSGARLDERKLGVLSDVYVRCFRVCVEAARQQRAGAIVALVTNGSFLDGPVHRGMRAALLRWFDELHVLDLGGSALLGQRRTERDENVFGVRPSVAVTWLCRDPGQGPAAEGGKRSRLHYARLRGGRVEKLERLAGLERWQEAVFEPEAPLLRFVPTSRRDLAYASYPSLAGCMPFHREGVQSNRDAVVVDDDPARLLERLHAFARGAALPELARAGAALPHYDPARARVRVAEVLERDPDGALGLALQPLAYRPFDTRWFCPVAPLCHRPRPELQRAFAHGGGALVSVRKDRGDLPWTHVAWAAHNVDNCFLSARSSCRARAFPLRDPDGRLNLAADGCEELPFYVLCLLSAASYQRRWNDELQQDYPRIAMARDAQVFASLVEHGRHLARLYSEPCPAGEGLPEPPPRAHFRDLELHAADGGVLLDGDKLWQLDPGALALRVGHHRPLAGYIAARADRPLDRSGLGEVYARARRLEALVNALRACDRAVNEAQP